MRTTKVVMTILSAIEIQTAYAGQYYRVFIVGCKKAGKTEEVCEAFTDD